MTYVFKSVSGSHAPFDFLPSTLPCVWRWMYTGVLFSEKHLFLRTCIDFINGLGAVVRPTCYDVNRWIWGVSYGWEMEVFEEMRWSVGSSSVAYQWNNLWPISRAKFCDWEFKARDTNIRYDRYFQNPPKRQNIFASWQLSSWPQNSLAIKSSSSRRFILNSRCPQIRLYSLQKLLFRIFGVRMKIPLCLR